MFSRQLCHRKTSSPFKNVLREGLRTSNYALEKNDFSFPNNTDVFGWTTECWVIFEGIDLSKAESYNTLDLAGNSVLHHTIDASDGDSTERRRPFTIALRRFEEFKLLGNSGLLTARCNKQTIVHRAARLGHEYKKLVLSSLLRSENNLYPTDLFNAADIFGRTALCLAAYYGNSEDVKLLCEKMDQQGRS